MNRPGWYPDDALPLPEQPPLPHTFAPGTLTVGEDIVESLAVLEARIRALEDALELYTR